MCLLVEELEVYSIWLVKNRTAIILKKAGVEVVAM